MPATAWTDAQLDSMRGIGDPIADAVVADLFASGQVTAVNQLMRTLIDNDDVPAAALPGSVRDYLQQTAILPSWTDAQRIRRGEQVFWQYGSVIVTCLFCYGLPACYAARKGVQVLALTARLHSNTTRRIIETAQMMVDVMRPGGLARGGKGIRTVQKVRLMHAAVRHLIGKHDSWNPAWGAPINQEDLAGTLMAFSWIVVDGLRKLGYSLSDQDAEDFLYAWRVVGSLMGIRDEMLPADIRSAAALMQAIAARQYAACPEGQELTRDLMKMLQYHLPGNIFDPVPAALTRYLLGDAASDLLAIERHTLLSALALPMRLIGLKTDAALDRSPALRQLSTIFSRKLIESIVLVGRGGTRVSFDLPNDLRQTWGVNWLG